MRASLIVTDLLILALCYALVAQGRRIKTLEERQPAQPTPSPVQFRLGEGQEPSALEPDLA